MSEAFRDRPSQDGESPNATGSAIANADWTGEQAGGLAGGQAGGQAKRDHRNPISIAMMFYILTLAGIIAACIGRIAQQEAVSKNYAMASIAGGCFLGLLIGFLGGTLYHKSIKASLVGSVAGPVIGALAGALTLIHHEHFLGTMSTAFLGSWLVLVTMLAAARWQVR